MALTVDIPDFSQLVNRAINRTEERVLVEVENAARISAPVDTGFYRNSIIRMPSDMSVIATAEYSAAIEYGVGGTARQPNPIMRNAARDVQGRVPSIFARAFR